MFGIWTRANPNIRLFEDESADFSQIFEDLAKYSDLSNPNPGSGGRIFVLPFTGDEHSSINGVRNRI